MIGNLTAPKKKMSDMKRNVENAKLRSQNLKYNLRDAKVRNREYLSSVWKLNRMENDVHLEDRNLARLGNDLESAAKQLEKIPHNRSLLYANSGDCVSRSSSGERWRKIKGSSKVMIPTRSNKRLSLDYLLMDENALKRTMGQLKGQHVKQERKKLSLTRERDRLSSEVRMMKEAFEKIQKLHDDGKSQRHRRYSTLA